MLEFKNRAILITGAAQRLGFALGIIVKYTRHD